MKRKILNIFILLLIMMLPNLYAESSGDEEVITFPKMIVPDPGFRIPDQLVFTGRFLDKETKRPIPNIKLEILAGKTKLINGSTDSNGKYEIAVPIKKFSIAVFKSITKGDITFKFFFWGKEVAIFHLKSPPKIEDIINSGIKKHGYNWRFQNKNEYRKKNNFIRVNVYNSLVSGSLASWITAEAASNLTRSKISLGDKYITWYGKSLIKVKVLIIAKVKTPDGLRYMNENDGQWWGCYKIMSGPKMGAEDCLESKKEHYLNYENILLQKTKHNQLVPGSLANLNIIDSLEKNLVSESKSSAEIGFWILSEKYSTSSQVWRENFGVEAKDSPNWWEDEAGKETEKGNVAVFVFENEIPGSEIEYKERLEVGQVFAGNFQIISKSGEVFYHKENVKLSNNAALKVLFFNGENFKIFDFKGPKIYNFYALRNKIRKRIKKYWEENSGILEYIAVKFGFEGENPLTDFHYSYEEKKQYKIYDGVPSLFEYIEAPAIQGAKFLVVVTKPLRKAIQLIYKSKTAQKLFIFIDKKVWSKIPKETQISIVKRIRKAGGEIARKGVLSKKWQDLLQKIKNSNKFNLIGNWKHAPKANSDVIIYHGSRHDSIKIANNGLDINLPTNASRDIKAAEDAISNVIGDVPTTPGIIKSIIPKDIWNALAKKGHIFERSYPGFSGKLISTEMRLNTEEAIKAFNNGILK